MLLEHPAVFFADFGVPCSGAGVSFTGLLDKPDESLNMSGLSMLSTMYVLTVQAADLAAAAITSGSTVTVAGQPYTVRDCLSIDDGALYHLTLSR